MITWQGRLGAVPDQVWARPPLASPVPERDEPASEPEPDAGHAARVGGLKSEITELLGKVAAELAQHRPGWSEVELRAEVLRLAGWPEAAELARLGEDAAFALLQRTRDCLLTVRSRVLGGQI